MSSMKKKKTGVRGIENDRESVAGCGGQESPLRYGNILIEI